MGRGQAIAGLCLAVGLGIANGYLTFEPALRDQQGKDGEEFKAVHGGGGEVGAQAQVVGEVRSEKPEMSVRDTGGNGK